MWLEPLAMFQEIYLKFNLYLVTVSTAFGELCFAQATSVRGYGLRGNTHNFYALCLLAHLC